MAGLNLQAIREALAAQITANLDRKPSVHAYDPGDHAGHSIIVRPGDPYATFFETFGTNGVSTVLLDIDIEVPATQAASAAIAMDDYLSVGTGNNSSVVDAIHTDPTLGGVVATCICQAADAPTERDDGVLVGRLHLEIKVHKIGASV